jgi:glycosyltransferase involved in cell wall biosynthesis
MSGLLCTSNYRANRGFAWDYFEGLYAAIADHLAQHGVHTVVAYPSIPSPPKQLANSVARPVEIDCWLKTLRSIRSMMALIRQENIKEIYFTDRPSWSLAYVLLRLAGVRRIVVHDHASGLGTPPWGLRRAVKWLLVRTPGLFADVVIAASDYVARRQIDVGLIPASRVVRLLYGIPLPADRNGQPGRAHAAFGISANRPIIMSSCRAAPEKGVIHLLRAFDRAAQAVNGIAPKPVLLYLGDGPLLPELRKLRESLASRDDIILAGYRTDAKEILEDADICVVPSVWQDAFPLAVLDAMARAKPVIATSVGGIPEMIKDDVHGILVAPADENALSSAILALVFNPPRAARLGAAARERIAQHFQPEKYIAQLLEIIEAGFQPPCDAVRTKAVEKAVVSDQLVVSD